MSRPPPRSPLFPYTTLFRSTPATFAPEVLSKEGLPSLTRFGRPMGCEPEVPSWQSGRGGSKGPGLQKQSGRDFPSLPAPPCQQQAEMRRDLERSVPSRVPQPEGRKPRVPTAWIGHLECP